MIIPDTFHSDGCTKAPDSIFGYNLVDACREHDWAYCTRCHPPGTLTWQNKNRADTQFKRRLKAILPWHLQWLRAIYYAMAWFGGSFGAYDTCGPSAGILCRHNQPRPLWMMPPTEV